jgi:hypothetical protein
MRLASGKQGPAMFGRKIIAEDEHGRMNWQKTSGYNQGCSTLFTEGH